MSTSTPLDDVAFLARSSHRLGVLRALADGRRTRRDLHEETGISQPTLGRILGDFEARTWVERDGQEYALSRGGALVAAEFDAVLDTVGAVHRLGDVLGGVPTDAGFDPARLVDATVTTPSPGDLFRHIRRAETVVAAADRLRLVANTIAPDSLRLLHERVLASTPRNGELETLAESVLTTSALRQVLAIDSLVPVVRDLVASGRAPAYRYDGDVEMTFGLADGVAILAPVDEHGMPLALVESTDRVVRDWAEAEFERYRAASTRL
jgi:predicted transcriptional regulator